MANHIRHGKHKPGAPTCRRTGAPRDPSEEDSGGQRALEARARQKAAAERGAPDQEKPKDKDQYSFTDPQSRIMPGADDIPVKLRTGCIHPDRKGGKESFLKSRHHVKLTRNDLAADVPDILDISPRGPWPALSAVTSNQENLKCSHEQVSCAFEHFRAHRGLRQ